MDIQIYKMGHLNVELDIWKAALYRIEPVLELDRCVLQILLNRRGILVLFLFFESVNFEDTI